MVSTGTQSPTSGAYVWLDNVLEGGQGARVGTLLPELTSGELAVTRAWRHVCQCPVFPAMFHVGFA